MLRGTKNAMKKLALGLPLLMLLSGCTWLDDWSLNPMNWGGDDEPEVIEYEPVIEPENETADEILEGTY